jgi:Retinal pigment epithelial membrane protein
MESFNLLILAVAVLVSFPVFKMMKVQKSMDTPMFRNTTEIPQPVALPVTGQLPDWLNGTLFRIGQLQAEDM